MKKQQTLSNNLIEFSKNAAILEKEDGLFATDQNIIYTTNGLNWIDDEGTIISNSNFFHTNNI